MRRKELYSIMSKKSRTTAAKSFAERHPRWYSFIGILLLLVIVAGSIAVVNYAVKMIGQAVRSFVSWISTVASTLDAVIIVALIAGAVSITGVVISSIFAKSLEYRKERREYLTQKREKPYGEFIDMVYKLQQDGKNVWLTEEIMNAMRKDLGLRKVKKGNLLSFFINDIKDAMRNANK